MESRVCCRVSPSAFQHRLHYARATFRNRKIEKSGIDWPLTTRQRQGSRFHEGKTIVNDPQPCRTTGYELVKTVRPWNSNFFI